MRDSIPAARIQAHTCVNKRIHFNTARNAAWLFLAYAGLSLKLPLAIDWSLEHQPAASKTVARLRPPLDAFSKVVDASGSSGGARGASSSTDAIAGTTSRAAAAAGISRSSALPGSRSAGTIGAAASPGGATSKVQLRSAASLNAHSSLPQLPLPEQSSAAGSALQPLQLRPQWTPLRMSSESLPASETWLAVDAVAQALPSSDAPESSDSLARRVSGKLAGALCNTVLHF